MTRKDFEPIAEVLAGCTPGPDGPVKIHADIVYRFAEALKGTNPRFNAERFVRACVGEPASGNLL